MHRRARLVLLPVSLAAALGAPSALAGASGPSLAAIDRAGIAGRAVAGPVCPVERYPPDPRCAPRPVKARVRVRGGAVNRVLATDAAGRFFLHVRPGRYTVTGLPPSSGSAFPRPPAPRRVTVRAGATTHIILEYDTGIR